MKCMCENGLEDIKGITYWPQSNGEVENHNKTLLKMARIAKIESKEFRREVEQFLFSYRCTPHCSSGISPAELLFGRQLRTKIPTVTQLDEWVECESYRDQRVSDVIAWDTAQKLYNKENRDNKSNARSHVYQPGDQVLLRYQWRADKMTPFYEAAP